MQFLVPSLASSFRLGRCLTAAAPISAAVSAFYFLSVLIASFIAAPPAGAETPFEPTTNEPVHLGRKLVLPSTILQRDVTLHIWLPDDFDASSAEHTYPVLLANGTHGHKFFATIAGMVKHFGDRERMPETLVVAMDGLEVPLIHSHGMWGRSTLGGADDPTVGLRFLEQELLPFLERTYRAAPYRTLMGVSGSAIFPAYALTEAPHLFQNHIWIAAADVIGMGLDENSTFIDSLAERFGPEAASGPFRPKLYLGTADSDLDKRPEYVANLERLSERLGRSPGLQLHIETFDDADHYAVLVRSLTEFVALAFPPDRWSARYRDLAAEPGDPMEILDRYYKDLSREYGFPILPRADRWNSVNSLRFLVGHLIGLERPEDALSVARRLVRYRPSAPMAHAKLGDALSAVGKEAEAAASWAEAARLARRQEDPNLADYESQAAEGRQKAAEAAP